MGKWVCRKESSGHVERSGCVDRSGCVESTLLLVRLLRLSCVVFLPLPGDCCTMSYHTARVLTFAFKPDDESELYFTVSFVSR